jgi:hypothetical protein
MIHSQQAESPSRAHGEPGKVKRILYGGRWWLPRVRAVVNLVGPKLPMACLSIEGAPESELTNLLDSLMQIRVSN